MKLLELLLEITSDEMLNGWLNKGLITNEDIDLINKVTTNQNYRKWLGNLVKNQVLKTEDIYKFKDYLEVYQKYSKKYPIKDIKLIKTEKDLNDFKHISIKIMDLSYKSDDNISPLLNTNEIMYLKEVGIEYLGIVEGFQIFKVPMELKDNKESYKLYRDVLGKCSGDEINMCTINSFDNFNYYLNTDDLYFLYNYSIPESPYQIHVESLSFLDRSNEESMDKERKLSILRKLNLFRYFLYYIVKKSKHLEIIDVSINDLTNDEKKTLINNIIYLDNINLNMYGLELNDLTNVQRNDFINKIIQYRIGITTYGLKLEDLTPEQREKYINLLISNSLTFLTNEKSRSFDVSLNDLTPEQKKNYIDKKISDGKNLVSYGISFDDLTSEQKKKYIDFHFRIIHNEKQLNSYGISFDDLTPEQRKLIK